MLAISSSPGAAQSFNQFIAFGDSTVDSGWYRNAAPNSTNATFNTDFAIAVTEGGGVATTNPGPVNSQLLAGFFGLTANPANTPGGTDYATGDARNAQVNTGAIPNSLQGAVPTVTQIGNYLAANGGSANPNAIYLISSGGNDISYASANLPSASQSAYVVGAANALVAAVVSLQAAGARTFVVPDTPQSFGGAAIEALRATYNTTLWQGLAAAHVNFVPADINAMYRAVQSSPSTFGLLGGAGPACTQPAGIPSGWATMCSPTSTISTLVSPNAEYTHLFADDIHLSTAGQLIEADYEYSLVVAPTEISLLAETPVKTRQTMIETLLAEIGLSQQGRGVGTYNTWISGGISALGIQSSAPGMPGDPGAPLSATAGVDYAFAPGWLAGGAVSVGNTSQDFTLGGSFQQNEFAASAYAAYLGRPFWGDLIASAGYIHDQVDRVVPIGIAQLANTGSTNGSNLSLAAEGGYNFTSGLITHGPLVGMLLQRVYIDGYTESDPFAAAGGFTALSFASQIRDSAVSELGYQATMQLGNWSPFTKLTWDHEFAGADRTVTASLTTIAAPSYYMPALVLGSDWMTLSAGTIVCLGRGVSGFAMFTGEAAQKNVTSYGVQMGINVALSEWLASHAL